MKYSLGIHLPPGGGRWNFRFWPFFRSVFLFFCTKKLRFLGFFVRCSHMLGYFICFHFAVNPGPTALCRILDFWLRFTAIGELFANVKFPPLSSIAIQSRFVNSPRRSSGRYARFTTIQSIDSADTVKSTVMILLSRMMMWYCLANKMENSSQKICRPFAGRRTVHQKSADKRPTRLSLNYRDIRELLVDDKIFIVRVHIQSPRKKR